MPLNNVLQSNNVKIQIEELQGIVNKSEEDFIRAQKELKTAEQNFTTANSKAELEIKQLNKAEKELNKPRDYLYRVENELKKAKEEFDKAYSIVKLAEERVVTAEDELSMAKIKLESAEGIVEMISSTYKFNKTQLLLLKSNTQKNGNNGKNGNTRKNKNKNGK